MKARRIVALSLALATLASSSAVFAKKTESDQVETRTNPLVYLGFGMAGGGLVLGVLYGVDSMHSTDAARERCAGNRCPPSTFDNIDSARNAAWISTISFGLAAVGVGLGVIGLANPVQSKSTAATKTSPTVSLSLGAGSAFVTGSF